MNSTDKKDPSYWVITSTELAFGPYDDYDVAYEFGITNLGQEGWTITTT